MGEPEEHHGVIVVRSYTCEVCWTEGVKVKFLPLQRWDGQLVAVCEMCIRDISKGFRGFK